MVLLTEALPERLSSNTSVQTVNENDTTFQPPEPEREPHGSTQTVSVDYLGVRVDQLYVSKITFFRSL